MPLNLHVGVFYFHFGPSGAPGGSPRTCLLPPAQVLPGASGSSVRETVAAQSASCKDTRGPPHQPGRGAGSSAAGRGCLAGDGADVAALRPLLCGTGRPPGPGRSHRGGREDQTGLLWTPSQLQSRGRAPSGGALPSITWCCPASALSRGCYWRLEKWEGRSLPPFQLPQNRPPRGTSVSLVTGGTTLRFITRILGRRMPEASRVPTFRLRSWGAPLAPRSQSTAVFT